MEEEQPFLDMKHQEVNPGDYVMYPVANHMRLAVVTRINGYCYLRVKYIRGRYAAGEDNKFVFGAQTINTWARDIIKITERDIYDMLNREEAACLHQSSREILNKL